MKVLNLLITLDHGWGTYLLSRAAKWINNAQRMCCALSLAGRKM